ncbi:hypothetical protein EVAR_59149_1 [Eumeta japonica]|uniref:Uncharacterized protein n=1 Tax=Eumeta variegata TaxID=151549 RepID=A0A4C1ZDU9_EUMVA|nr:hypothetical protein EVAR_59149_1 [Eumeta japonica]
MAESRVRTLTPLFYSLFTRRSFISAGRRRLRAAIFTEVATSLILTDDLRERRPSTVTTEDNVSAVRLMMETEKRVIYQ